MGNDQAQRVTMIRPQGLSVVMRGKQYSIAVQVRQRNVGSVSLLGVHQDVSSFLGGTNSFQHLSKRDTFPAVVKPAPARDAMKIAGALHLGQGIEFVPCKRQWRLHQAVDPE